MKDTLLRCSSGAGVVCTLCGAGVVNEPKPHALLSSSHWAQDSLNARSVDFAAVRSLSHLCTLSVHCVHIGSLSYLHSFAKTMHCDGVFWLEVKFFHKSTFLSSNQFGFLYNLYNCNIKAVNSLQRKEKACIMEEAEYQESGD